MRTMICALAAITLVGCATPTVVAVNNKLPESLLVDCEYAPPPDRSQYKVASWSEREKMWKQSYDKSILNVANCNPRFKQLRAINAEQ